MLTDVKGMLEETRIKVAENCFSKPPDLPYIVFLDERNYNGADKKVCIVTRVLTVELYSKKIDKDIENKIEGILIKNSIEFNKNRTWIDSEKFFQTVYDFNLYEKI